mmetsp:Transcript_110990/g.277877  ORF Transcript_110990/g.277877 Transcript_110990/m.277877 type:complete len:261 (-) Transcript_110990:2138-2920(-)
MVSSVERTFSRARWAFLTVSAFASTAPPGMALPPMPTVASCASTSTSALWKDSSAALAAAVASAAAEAAAEKASLLLAVLCWHRRKESCMFTLYRPAFSNRCCPAASNFLTCASADRFSFKVSSAAERLSLANSHSELISSSSLALRSRSASARCRASVAFCSLLSAALSFSLASATMAAQFSSSSSSASCATVPYSEAKSLRPTEGPAWSHPSLQPSSAAALLTTSSPSLPCFSWSNFRVSPSSGGVHSKSARISRAVK